MVGEDLGTVPRGVRRRMARDRMLRTWVFQFESTPEDPLPSPPANCLATLSTHDLPRFGAYLWGDDIAARERLGALTPDQSADELAARAEWRGRLLRVLGTSSEGASEAAVTAAALRGCLAHLARSDAAIVLVDLEELWDERQPQNVPGTGPEAGNWRRRSARTIEEISHDPSVGDVLATVERDDAPREVAPSAAGRRGAHRRGRLSLQRGDAPRAWPGSSGRTPCPTGRARFAVWAPNAVPCQRHRGLQRLGLPAPTPCAPRRLGDLGGPRGLGDRRPGLQVRHHHHAGQRSRRRPILSPSAPRFPRGPAPSCGTSASSGATGNGWRADTGTWHSTRPCRSTRCTWGVGCAIRAIRRPT